MEKKCRNCEFLIVDTVNDTVTRGRGHCFRKPLPKYDIIYYERVEKQDISKHRRVRYFSDPVCPKYKERTSGLAIGNGTK